MFLTARRPTVYLQCTKRIATQKPQLPQGTSSRRLSTNSNSKTGKQKEPLFKIPAHIAVFTLLLSPVAAYMVVFYNGRTERDDELEARIRQRYGENVASTTSSNNRFGEFYRSAILSDGDDDRIRQVLYSGKGEKKRFHKIDEELYGTQKGQEERKRMEEELLAEKKRRRAKRKRKKEPQEESVETETPVPPADVGAAVTSNTTLISKQVITVASVGVLAAVVGFLLGGGRRS